MNDEDTAEVCQKFLITESFSFYKSLNSYWRLLVFLLLENGARLVEDCSFSDVC